MNKNHNLAMSHPPKLAAVRAGDCRQTIRSERGIRPGDMLWLFAWSGRPRRSPWAWRRRARVSQVYRGTYHDWGMMLDGEHPPTTVAIPWDSPEMDRIAALDWIDPPTGVALRDVLAGYGMRDGTRLEIIQWVPRSSGVCGGCHAASSMSEMIRTYVGGRPEWRCARCVGGNFAYPLVMSNRGLGTGGGV